MALSSQSPMPPLNAPVPDSSSEANPSRAIHGLLLALIAGVALAFRLWRIDVLPPGFHFDESFEALEAWRIVTDPTYRPIFLEGNFGVAPLNAYVTALGFWLGNLVGIAPGPALMRATIAIVGVLTVLATYTLAAEMRLHDHTGTNSGRLSIWFPLWAAAVLAILRWHVHFSRMGIEPIYVPLEWIVATWGLLRGWRTGHWLPFAIMGAVLALSLYTYQGAWVLPFVIAAAALLLLLLDRTPAAAANVTATQSRRWVGLGIAFVTALALAAPLLLYFASNPDLVMLRPAQVNVAGATASPADAGLLANTWATIAMYFPFGSTGDLDPRRNLPGAPALDLWLAIPFALGVLLALRHIRRTPYWMLLLGLAGLLSVGIFTEYAPHFHRILGAAAPTALLCAVGLDAIWQWRPARAPFLRWLAVALILLATVTNWRDYHVRWAALPDLYHAFDQGLWEIGNWIADQPADEPIYLTPRSADHPTLQFAWTVRAAETSHAAPVTFDGRAIFPVTQDANARAESYVVITHEDFRTPLLLPEVLAAATVTEQFIDWSGAPYASVYTRPPNTEAQRPPFQTLALPIGDGIALMGYDVQPATPHPGAVLYVQLHWLVEQTPQQEWTVYIHLLDPARSDAAPLVGHDGPPGAGSLITTRWQAGWRVLDEYQLQLPADLPPGEYVLAAGLYTTDGARLPADGAPVTLGTVVISANE